jgi:uncharacterized coiled-coil DUF342 family protein
LREKFEKLVKRFDEEKRRADELTKLADKEKRRVDELTKLADEEKRRVDELTKLADEEKRRADEATKLADEATKVRQEKKEPLIPLRNSTMKFKLWLKLFWIIQSLTSSRLNNASPTVV